MCKPSSADQQTFHTKMRSSQHVICAEEQRQAILNVVFAKQAAGTTPGSAQHATPNGSAGGGQAAAANGHAEQAAPADGCVGPDQPADEQQQQQAGSNDSGAGVEGEAEVHEGVPLTLERQRNKRQRRKPAQGAEEG